MADRPADRASSSAVIRSSPCAPIRTNSSWRVTGVPGTSVTSAITASIATLTDERDADATDQRGRAVRERAVPAVTVAHGEGGDPRRTRGHERRPVADAVTGRQLRDADGPRVEAEHRSDPRRRRLAAGARIDAGGDEPVEAEPRADGVPARGALPRIPPLPARWRRTAGRPGPTRPPRRAVRATRGRSRPGANRRRPLGGGEVAPDAGEPDARRGPDPVGWCRRRPRGPPRPRPSPVSTSTCTTSGRLPAPSVAATRSASARTPGRGLARAEADGDAAGDRGRDAGRRIGNRTSSRERDPGGAELDASSRVATDRPSAPAASRAWATATAPCP